MGKKEETKKRISIALYKLMYHYSFEDISIKMICEQAKVSRMSFYRYYTDKHDLFIAYCDERFEEFFNDIKSIPNPTLIDISTALFSYFYKFRREIKILRLAHQFDLLRPQFEQYTQYVFSKINFFKKERIKTNPLAVPFIAGGMYNILLHWVDNDFKESEFDMNLRSIQLFGSIYSSSN